MGLFDEAKNMLGDRNNNDQQGGYDQSQGGGFDQSQQGGGFDQNQSGGGYDQNQGGNGGNFGGDQQQSMGRDNFDQSSSSGGGYGDQQSSSGGGGLMQDAERMMGGGNSGGNGMGGQQSSSGGGFMKGAESMGEDAMVNQEVNSFMNKEGVPVGADGAVDGFVDKEANKFM